MSYQTVKEIVDTVIRTETKLKDFYDVAEYALKNERAKRVLIIIRESLSKRIEIVKSMEIDKSIKLEWTKTVPSDTEYQQVFIKDITRISSPEEIFAHILKVLEKQKEFYAIIKDSLPSGKATELFDGLNKFKIQQIIEIKKFMQDFDLVI